MFKKLKGLQNVVKGGISAVVETSNDLGEKAFNDPTTSTTSIKENIKKKYADVVSTGEHIAEQTEAKERVDDVTKVVHKVKHYGGFTEDFLGYEDPNKDLRKAVKAKEKAAKKARKAKKKKTGKKEDDLFDPENLAKFKAELEERKRREAEFAAQQAGEAAEDVSDSDAEGGAGAVSDTPVKGEESKDNKEIKFTLDLADPISTLNTSNSGQNSLATTPLANKLPSPLTPVRAKEDTEDWKAFSALTSGIDSLIKQKQEDLEDIKVDSYFQKKKTSPVVEDADDSDTDPEKVLGAGDNSSKKKKKKKKGKKWVDLDQEGFDDIEGSIPSSESEPEDPDEKADRKELEVGAEANVDNDEDSEDKSIGLVEIPEDDPIDLDLEEDLFNTAHVDAVISGDIKLAVIPDDPIFDDNDDPFNTEIADEIFKKDKQEKRKEATKLKFSGLSSVADVLSGKADKVDPSLIEHSTKRKRRRANRINLIGDQEKDLTAREDIGVVDLSIDPDQKDILTTTTEKSSGGDQDNNNLDVEVADLLSSTPSPLPTSAADKVLDDSKKSDKFFDLSEFEVLEQENKASVALTSNVAILAGEFSKPVEEEVDDFDAAFDALAQESHTRSKLEELEKQWEDADVFDTTCADTVLQLASLTNKVEVIEEELDTFEDKDPFDTSAYEHITGDLEADWDFDSLAKRGPDNDCPELKTIQSTNDLDDEFAGWDKVKPVQDQGWAAFEEPKPKKPSRPPPPKKPPPPRPSKPSKNNNRLDPRNNPSVVVKAPSTESIKSWNCSTADNLIKKNIRRESSDSAFEKEPLEEEDEAEDPFDTSHLDAIIDKEEAEDPFDTSAFKTPEPEKSEEEKFPEPEDPFDLSHCRTPEPEYQKDLLTSLDNDEDTSNLGNVTEAVVIVPTAVVADPFNTDIASEVLPNKGDPFDTAHVKGGIGRAEIKALEEEFLDPECEFDPREGTKAPTKIVAAGAAGRARPRRGQQTDLIVKAPSTAAEQQEDIDPEDGDDFVDPFDTTIVDKVIPVRKAIKSADLAVEDEDFNPTSTFNSTKEEIDPFDTTIAGEVIPELADKKEESIAAIEVEEKEEEPVEIQRPSTPPLPASEIKPETKKQPPPPPPPKKVDEIARKYGRARPKKALARQLTDEDFDPRS